MYKDTAALLTSTKHSRNIMTKKNKINKLVRNPFTNTRQTSDRIEDTASGNEDDDDDEDDDDEERVIRARRDTLVALDPNNKDSRNAEFKYLSAKAQRMRARTNAFEQQQRQASTQLQYQPYAREEPGQYYRALLDQQTTLSDHVQGMTETGSEARPTLERQDDVNDRSGNNLLCTPKPKKIDELVPEIYISLPTPSPPTFRRKNRNESSLGDTNPLLLSTTFTPSPLSLSSRDPLEDSALNISPCKAKTRSNRSSNVYKSLFQRFTGSPAPRELDTNEITDQAPSVVEANQPIVQSSSTSWSLNRNTFGAPIKSALADRGHQSRSTGWRPSRTSRVGRTEKHDPWDSCDDMLMETTDDENVDNPTSCWREESQLKGRIGVGERRRCDDTAFEDIQCSVIPRLGRGALDGWIAQPRAAAIWGTANKIDDAVPVPKQQLRPQSLPSDHTVIDLMSPPERAHHNPTAAGTGVILARAGSLGSSFNRLQRGPPSMTADLNLPSSLDNRTDRTMRIENRVQGTGEKAQQEVYDTTGDRESHSINESIDRSDQRSSSRTFGPTHISKVTPPPATLSSFSSLRDLVTSAVRLNRSCSATEDISPPTYSPSAYLRRSQTTTFVGHHSSGDSSSGPVSFSPVSKCKNSPAMIPKIVVLKDLPHGMSALSAIPVFSRTLDSASSSLTVIPGVENPHRSQDGISLYRKEAFTTDWLNEDTAASEERATVDHHPTFHRLRLQPEQESLLKVPKPVMVQNTNKIRQETSLATTAMETARHTVLLSNTSQFINESGRLTRSPDFADSLTSQLMGADYIGEFERERAQARGGEGLGSNSTPSLSPSCTSSTTTVAMSQLLSSTGKLEDNGQYHLRRPEKIVLEKTMDKGYSSDITMEDHYRGGSDSDSNNVSGGGRHKRQGSSQSDMSEKLMHLPEPSRLVGICSCRGMINVVSMLFVMVGLVLMILGYPIAASLKKDRLEAEMQAMRNETMFTMSNHTAVNWTAHQPTVATTTTLIPSTTVVVLPKITASAVQVGLW